MNLECRLSVKSFFYVDGRPAALLFRKQPEADYFNDGTITNRPALGPLRTRDLSPGQQSLVDLMRVHQFGRIENMLVRAGVPILNSDVKVVRVARLGGGSDAGKVTRTDEFELKRQVRDLFDELGRLENGTVVRLEFRHGMPFLVETTPTILRAPEPSPKIESTKSARTSDLV